MLELQIKVVCTNCRSELETTYDEKDQLIEVEFCKDCRKYEYQLGVDQGYKDCDDNFTVEEEAADE